MKMEKMMGVAAAPRENAPFHGPRPQYPKAGLHPAPRVSAGPQGDKYQYKPNYHDGDHEVPQRTKDLMRIRETHQVEKVLNDEPIVEERRTARSKMDPPVGVLSKSPEELEPRQVTMGKPEASFEQADVSLLGAQQELKAAVAKRH
jgi:hypothetical protein